MSAHYKHRVQWANGDDAFLTFLVKFHKSFPGKYPTSKKEARELYDDEGEDVFNAQMESLSLNSHGEESNDLQHRSGEKSDVQDAKGDLFTTKPRAHPTGVNPPKTPKGAKADNTTNSAKKVGGMPSPMTPVTPQQADKHNYDNNKKRPEERAYYEATKLLTPADKKEYDYNNGRMSDSQKEKHERFSGKKVLKPTERTDKEKNLKLIGIFCGAGKHCGHEVKYELNGEYPCYCDGSEKKRSVESAGYRVNHQCKFADAVCVHNRCLIEDKDLPWLMSHHCCPVCKRALHGGISSQYGIVFH